MRFEILQRLKELQQKLGPLLEELDIKTKVRRRNGEIAITFEGRGGNTRAPVEVHLHPNAFSGGEESGWEGSDVVIEHWDWREIGSNGWIYERYAGMASLIPLDDDLEKSLDAIGCAIEQHGLVYVGKELPNRTCNKNFALAYEHIRDAFPPARGRRPITCSREGNTESYNFTAPSGAKWRVSFNEENAVLYVDGKEVALLPAVKPRKIGAYISERMARATSYEAVFSASTDALKP
jgi:hypothetical protein